MPVDRTETSLTVEQEVSAPGRGTRTLRLTARLGSDRRPPTAEELGEAIGQLDRELGEGARLAGFVPASPARADRGVDELVELYRPRQAELVELLLSDGEISVAEANALRQYLAGPLASTAAQLPARDEVPVTDRPIAAAPLEGDRTPSRARPVPELISRYQIESLRQAGAVRARRQISFEEYMALKRHFAATDAAAAPPVRSS